MVAHACTAVNEKKDKKKNKKKKTPCVFVEAFSIARWPLLATVLGISSWQWLSYWIW